MATNYVKFDTKAVDKLLVTLEKRGRQFPSEVQENLYAIGQAASELIMNALEESLPIKIRKFMVDRTTIDITTMPSAIILEIRGMSEGEAGHPPREDGTVPIVSNDDVNLWLTHEFGRKPGSSKGHGRGSPYVGEIRRIVSGLSVQLEGVLRTFGVIMTRGAVESALAEGGGWDMTATVGSILSSSGLSPAGISSFGLGNIEITPRGQINIRGAKGRYVGHGGKVPTTIKGAGRSK